MGIKSQTFGLFFGGRKEEVKHGGHLDQRPKPFLTFILKFSHNWKHADDVFLPFDVRRRFRCFLQEVALARRQRLSDSFSNFPLIISGLSYWEPVQWTLTGSTFTGILVKPHQCLSEETVL